MTPGLRIGVVVIGRNEGERLRRCLRSLPIGLPTVYVDSGSTDGSVALARALDIVVTELTLTSPFTAARARAAGVATLLALDPRVEAIQFVDGDCELEPEWIAIAICFLEEHPGVAVVCGRRRERFPHASFYNELADREWDTPIGEAAACGGDALYRRAAYEESGGFDAAIIAGEEPELCSRIRANGGRIWRIDAPMTVHDAALHRFGQWWLRAVRGGFAYAQVWRRSRGRPYPLYARELARAFGWAIGIPLIAIMTASIVGPTGLLLAPTAWALQWARLARRTDQREAGFLLIGKAAEAIGALRFVAGQLRDRRSGAIFYK